MAIEISINTPNQRAVSPVIGVLLMVGIVVALGVVVFDVTDSLGENTGEVPPNTDLDYDYTQTGADNVLEISHGGGDVLNDGTVGQLRIVFDTNDGLDQDVVDEVGDGIEDTPVSGSTYGMEDDGSLSLGDTLFVIDDGTASEDFSPGDNVAIIWVSESGQQTEQIGDYTVPDA